MTIIILCALLFLNLFTFFLMRYDKKCARENRRRVPEKTLFLAAALFGASYGLTKGAIALWPRVPTEILKAAVDLVLFLASYAVQRVFVFRRKGAPA